MNEGFQDDLSCRAHHSSNHVILQRHYVVSLAAWRSGKIIASLTTRSRAEHASSRLTQLASGLKLFKAGDGDSHGLEVCWGTPYTSSDTFPCITRWAVMVDAVQ